MRWSIVWLMATHAEQVLSRLRDVLAELEGLAKPAADSSGVTRGARAADDYVHEHAWMSVAVAAAVGFLLGALTNRHD